MTPSIIQLLTEVVHSQCWNNFWLWIKMEEIYALNSMCSSWKHYYSFTKMIIIRPRFTLASVTHNTFIMFLLQDIKVTVAVRDCGMWLKQSTMHHRESTRIVKTKRPSSTCWLLALWENGQGGVSMWTGLWYRQKICWPRAVILL